MKLSEMQLLLTAIAIIILAAIPIRAHAQCTTPAGTEGQIFYNTTHKVVQFCNGTTWVNTGAFANSALPAICDPGDTVTWTGTTWTCISAGGGGGPDTTPDAFSFTDVTDAALNTQITSTSIIVSGIDAPSAVTVTGGAEFRIAGTGGWKTAGDITNGQTLELRRTSSTSPSTAVSTTVTVGGVSNTWTVTTGAACGGYSYDGYCYYYANAGQGCDSVCTGKGGCNLVGTAHIASNATNNDKCADVLTALRGQSTAVTTSSSANYGCNWNNAHPPGRRRTGTTSCSGSHSNLRRACACNN